MKTGLVGAGYFSTVAAVPNWIVQSAQAIVDLSGEDRILVVVQLEGGNDGLNTVVPFTDPLYNDEFRPTLLLPSNQMLPIDSLNALNINLAGLAEWFGKGRLAIIQNIGYPNPNLSHFLSTDLWAQGRIPGGPDLGSEGWLGRTFDRTCRGNTNPDPLAMVGVGHSRIPDALKALNFAAPAIEEIDGYELDAPEDFLAEFGQRRIEAIAAMNQVPTSDPNLGFIQSTSDLARRSIDLVADIRDTAYQPPAGVDYPVQYKLGRDLLLCSQIIHQPGIKPRILHVRQPGYDTHANQLQDQSSLLMTLDHSLDAFLKDLEDTGELDRVVVMTFSEFGRRVEENGSEGTDHGASSMLFVAGGSVIGGVYGGQPNLADLQKGNLKQNPDYDFRNVYAEILSEWFLIPHEPIFGEQLASIGFLPNTVLAAHKSWAAYE